MPLSTRSRSAAAATFLAITAAGCSSSPSPNVLPGPSAISRSTFPFPLKEPEAWSADLVVTSAGRTHRWHAARKADKWRYDFYNGTTLFKSQIKTDTLYTLDPATKTYNVEAASIGSGPVTTELEDIAFGFIDHLKRLEFDDLGQTGTIYKYRAHDHGGGSQVLVSYDTAVGIITRQEFLAPDGNVTSTFELQNFLSDVGDDVFQIPADYRGSGPK